MEFWVVVHDGKVDRVAFVTDGCGSSRACGSMATTLAEGRAVEDAAALRQEDILAALWGVFPDGHCARLAANTLKAACEDTRRHQDEAEGPPQPTACSTCGKKCSVAQRAAGESDKEYQDRQKLHSRLCHIHHKIVVLSGKGGVGKSTVAVNLAVALMMTGKKVGLLDVDVHGPSIPTMLGLEDKTIEGCENGVLPIRLGGLSVMSVGFLLKSQDDAVIWRGPMKMKVIRQFLQEVAWGDLDYLIIDSPPGTGDEPLSVCNLISDLDGAVIVTTPQKVAAVDVRKSITFCRQLHVPIIGVVENMNGFVCPKCGEITRILSAGGGRRIAEDMQVPFLGSIPMDPRIAEACDSGQAFIQDYAATATAEIMQAIIEPIALFCEAAAQPAERSDER
jgi:Mrp family chromosome partitioning ATPase